MIHQGERNHGFNHGHGARHDARIVTTARLQFSFLAITIHSILSLRDRRRGFECNLHLNHFAVGDAALNPTRTVGSGTQPLLAIHIKFIIVLAALLQHAIEPTANFKALGRGQAHHRLGEVRFELVEHGRPQATRRVAHDASHHPTARIPSRAHLIDRINHFLCATFIWASNDVRFDVIHRHRRVVHALCLHVSHRAHVR
mmetsp:Transcript_4472/g.16370  ORF Transcript_4472/g.16370 Transcript_4472/m.16370 type:complete len:200 (+) Transcript_4472:232-831(+)